VLEVRQTWTRFSAATSAISSAGMMPHFPSCPQAIERLLAVDKQSHQYRLLVQIELEKYLGSFHTLRFRESKPFTGSCFHGQLDLFYYPNKPSRRTGPHRRRFRPPTPDGRKRSANRWQDDPGSSATPCSPGWARNARQDQEAAVVSHQAEATVALSGAPSDRDRLGKLFQIASKILCRIIRRPPVLYSE
jgi:hypothetical protein